MFYINSLTFLYRSNLKKKTNKQTVILIILNLQSRILLQ